MGGGGVSVGGEIGAEGEEDFGESVIVDVGEQGPSGGVGCVRVRRYQLRAAVGSAVRFPCVHLVGFHDDEVEESVQIDISRGGEPVVEAADGFPEGGAVAGRSRAVRDVEFIDLVASGQFHHPVVVEVGEHRHNGEFVRAHIDVGLPDDFRERDQFSTGDGVEDLVEGPDFRDAVTVDVGQGQARGFGIRS